MTTTLLWLIDWRKRTRTFISSENVLLLSISSNSLQTPSLDDILLGNFTLSNSAILVEDLIRWKRGFEIFLIKHGAGDIKNKNIAGKYSKTPVSVSTTLY